MVGGGGLELLQAQLQALGFRIGRKHHGAHGLSDLDPFAGVLDALFVGEFGNMDQAVDAVLHFHESPEVGKSCDLALDYFSVRVALLDGIPRIPQNLSQAQAQTSGGAVNLQDYRLDALSLLQYVARTLDAFGP